MSERKIDPVSDETRALDAAIAASFSVKSETMSWCV
jgi:hypothetical protein